MEHGTNTVVTFTTKDIAQEMQVDPRTVKRWWKKYRVPPDACTANRCHRWTEAAKEKLLKKVCAGGGRIRLPEPREPLNQLKFNFEAKRKPTFPKQWTNK